jgi:hypothetical protein
MITDATQAAALKETLQDVVEDPTTGSPGDLILNKYMSVGTMPDQYVDDQEYGGPGLAQQKSEGAQITLGSVQQGAGTRYFARTFALMLAISWEAVNDGKYEKALNLAGRNKRAILKTAEYDAINLFQKGWTTSLIGDGLSMFNTAHTIPIGGTFSNTLSTPMSPSRQAMMIVSNAIGILPGHDGTIEGYDVKAVVCPLSQRWAWRGIIGSTHAPEPGAFNEINVVNTDIDPTLVPVPFWTASSTNWAVTTTAENGAKFLWRMKPKATSWVENGQMAVNHANAARWDRNCSDPRGVYGSQA